MNLPALIQSLQEANRTIDELKDTIRGWKIQYDRLYRQHMKLQRQSWCPACQERYKKENDIELCLCCSHGIQKENRNLYTKPTYNRHVYFEIQLL